MKRCIGVFMLVLMAMGMVLPVAAQDDPPAPSEPMVSIAYGDKVSGEITNVNFDPTYTFEGEQGDVVLIQMVASELADFDPYLYLTTLQNELIASNDDYYNYNSRIIVRLPADGTYQIVATRLGERTGTGEGAFTLTLEKAQIAGVGVTIEGNASPSEPNPTHVFVAESAGVYTITYTHINGGYYPGVVISRLREGDSYEEDIAQISGQFMRGGSITLEIDLDAIYIFSVEDVYYSSYDASTATALYTIRVEAPAE